MEYPLFSSALSGPAAPDAHQIDLAATLSRHYFPVWVLSAFCGKARSLTRATQAEQPFCDVGCPESSSPLWRLHHSKNSAAARAAPPMHALPECRPGIQAPIVFRPERLYHWPVTREPFP
jgi:hypothetical protein